MATITAVSKSPFAALDVDRHDGLGMVLSAVMPLAMFVIANGLGQFVNAQPLFFSPFGLPGWAGSVLHLGCLPLFGVARWMVAGRGAAGQRAGWWIVALIAATIGFPFVVAPLDSMTLSMVAFAMLILGLGAMIRAGRVEPRAAMVMAPGMAWMGFSAFVGLSFAAAWSPPFAVTNSHTA